MQFKQQFSVVAKKSYVDKEGKDVTYISLLFVSPDKTEAELKGYRLPDNNITVQVGDFVNAECDYNRFGLRIERLTAD